MADLAEKHSNPEDDYELLKTIGQGASGAVYLGRNKSNENQVAIKKLPVVNANQLEECEREINVMKPLDCEFLIKFIESYYWQKEIWIVIEFAGRGSLGSILDKTKPRGFRKETHIAQVTKGIVGGLVYLHKLKIVHRDIKPGNVLVNDAGGIKLADFGISRQMERGQQAQTMVGTPQFLAPEIVTQSGPQGAGDGYGPKVDVWSCGMCCVEMADGKPPFWDLSPIQVLYQLSDKNLKVELTKKPERWSDQFKHFVNACMQSDPSKRPTSTQLQNHPFLKGAQPILDEDATVPLTGADDIDIIRCLGQGSAAAVFQALQYSSGDEVAVKKLLVEDKHQLKEVEKEIDIMKSTDSEYIVKYLTHYIKDEEKSLYIVMEFCGQGSLSELIAKALKSNNGETAFNSNQAAGVARGVMSGLQYMHGRNVVHRDIKPANILVKYDGHVKLADFGISRVVQAEAEKMQTMVGTPNYLAPEIVGTHADADGYTSNVDIWSFGVCLLEMADGRPPFHELPPMRVVLELSKKPTLTFKDPSKWDADHVSFTNACLRTTPEDRPSATVLLNHMFVTGVSPVLTRVDDDATAGSSSSKSKEKEKEKEKEKAFAFSKKDRKAKKQSSSSRRDKDKDKKSSRRDKDRGDRDKDRGDRDKDKDRDRDRSDRDKDRDKDRSDRDKDKESSSSSRVDTSKRRPSTPHRRNTKSDLNASKSMTTRASRRVPPEEDRKLWGEHKNSAGRVYWYNSVTKKSQWQRPACLADRSRDDADLVVGESRRESRDTGKSDRRDRRDRDKDRRKDRHRHRHGRPKKTPIQLDKSQNEALLGALADAEKTAEQEEVNNVGKPLLLTVHIPSVTVTKKMKFNSQATVANVTKIVVDALTKARLMQDVKLDSLALYLDNPEENAFQKPLEADARLSSFPDLNELYLIDEDDDDDDSSSSDSDVTPPAGFVLDTEANAPASPSPVARRGRGQGPPNRGGRGGMPGRGRGRGGVPPGGFGRPTNVKRNPDALGAVLALSGERKVDVPPSPGRQSPSVPPNMPARTVANNVRGPPVAPRRASAAQSERTSSPAAAPGPQKATSMPDLDARPITVALLVPHKTVKKMMRFPPSARFGDVRHALCQALYKSTIMHSADDPVDKFVMRVRGEGNPIVPLSDTLKQHNVIDLNEIYMTLPETTAAARPPSPPAVLSRGSYAGISRPSPPPARHRRTTLSNAARFVQRKVSTLHVVSKPANDDKTLYQPDTDDEEDPAPPSTDNNTNTTNNNTNSKPATTAPAATQPATSNDSATKAVSPRPAPIHLGSDNDDDSGDDPPPPDEPSSPRSPSPAATRAALRASSQRPPARQPPQQPPAAAAATTPAAPAAKPYQPSATASPAPANQYQSIPKAPQQHQTTTPQQPTQTKPSHATPATQQPSQQPSQQQRPQEQPPQRQPPQQPSQQPQQPQQQPQPQPQQQPQQPQPQQQQTTMPPVSVTTRMAAQATQPTSGVTPLLSAAEFRSKTTRELASFQWWRPQANRPTAEAELAHQGPGCFVVRPSSLDRCLALSHVDGRVGSVGHSVIRYKNDPQTGYSLEDNVEVYPDVLTLLQTLPLQFVTPLPPPYTTSPHHTSSQPIDINAVSQPAMHTPPTPASPATPATTPLVPSSPTPPLSSLSRDSFVQVQQTPTNSAQSTALTAKLARIRAALLNIVGEVETTAAKVKQVIDNPNSNIHALVPIATLFKTVRPTLEMGANVMNGFNLAPAGVPDSSLDKLDQLKFLLRISQSDVEGLLKESRKEISNDQINPKYLQSVANVIKEMQQKFIFQ